MAEEFKIENIFDNNRKNKISFQTALKTLPSKGNLVYEYNPFYNYRLDEDMFLYNNVFYTKKELVAKLKNIDIETINDDYVNSFYDNVNNAGGWYESGYIPKNYTIPILYQKGQLTDFTTNELQFDLNHPVTLTPSYSYDNSVDLVINDGISPPKLINSRFSAIERNQYIINDREGNNDTNIYDRGTQFEVDTSLYKKITSIPKLDFINVGYGGNLSVGNYNFYFKYVDDDGNESDFFAESGQIQIFIGTDPASIISGFRDEIAYKTITFLISNLDEAYQKIKVYYTKATSDIYQGANVTAHFINQPYVINSNAVKVSITGYEQTTEVPLEDINLLLQRYQAVETQAVCQNMLFFGHNYKIKQNYTELKDLALRFLPYVDNSAIYKPFNASYELNSTNIQNTYYNPVFIYNKTGYWSDIYRFGIVFIYNDLTLSDVYNVRGGWIEKINEIPTYTRIDVTDEDGIRKFISYNKADYLIVRDKENSDYTGDSKNLVKYENVKGVVKIPNDIALNEIVGIKFETTKEVLERLKELNITGFFFVRQKRIPTILCQAYTIGIDKQSNLPVNPDGPNHGWIEGFLDKDQLLTHHNENRFYEVDSNQIRKEGAICPEYDVNYPYFNSLFTGEKFTIEPYSGTYYSYNEDINDITRQDFRPNNTFYTTQIIGVEDNVKLMAIGNNHKFSGRAGEAEEAYRYAYIGSENKCTEATNLARGSFGPFLGMVGYDEMGKIVNIRIPHYNENEMESYFKIRYEDPYPYYAISDRLTLESYDLEDLKSDTINIGLFYRGDCFICNYTHRLNRNFQDPSAPTNDEIVDPNCWKNNYKVEDNVINIENFDKINLGDLNAVKLGKYITLCIKSSINLNIRAVDSSMTDEISLFGHPRSFSPYIFEPLEGTFKTPEALCYNKGFEKSVSEKFYIGLPDVPFLNEDFTNRISYSNIKISNSFQNGHRVFQGTHYRDYSKEYGSIIKLEEWKGNLIVVCEHGVLLVSVNERAVAAEGAQGFAYINTSNVLPENPKVISDKFGSQWRESVVKTPHYVYGVDTVARKIWRTDGNQMDYISDQRITEFLNHNISLTERELTPIIGVRNVKSHYNEFKGDVMFTFYDNLYGFEEKVWNICFNERLGKWITFYSWVPSYSENIYNSLFSFDRNTSKWIAKLGISKSDNSFSDGIVLSDNIIKEKDPFKVELSLANRNLPTGDNVTNTIIYTLERDNYGNHNKFKIITENNKQYLTFTGKYDDIRSEFYKRDSNNKIIKDDRGQRQWLSVNDQINPDKIVLLLNIRAKITTNTDKVPQELKDMYGSYEGSINTLSVDAGYYESVVAVIPEYNMQFLSTDFWRHGQAGIIDISDKIYPTYWYGKQHPFEFEFVVADNPDKHKIFDNLEIISNNAEPESFHYEIIGDSYEFAEDKKNMYIRQEATKELYQFNGADIVFDHNYKKLDSKSRELPSYSEIRNKYYDKSTIFPLYYYRQDKINEIEDSYPINEVEDYYNSFEDRDGKLKYKNFSALAGAEIVQYENLDEYRIWNHCRAIDMRDQEKGGRMRGNMMYKEDKWEVNINPINLVQNNELIEDWNTSIEKKPLSKPQVPAEFNLFPPPKELYDNEGNINSINLPNDWERSIVNWDIIDNMNKEVKIKDKWLKVRIRYSGKKLAIIQAIRTLYSISFA